MTKLINKIVSSKTGKRLCRILSPFILPIGFSRVVFGSRVFFNLRDHPFMIYSSRKELETCQGTSKVIEQLPPNSLVWDIGCNIGLYALYAAKLGHRVVAWDISPSAIELVNRSAVANGVDLQIRTVAKAFTDHFETYNIPRTARAGNKIEFSGTLSHSSVSMMWRQAVELYGVPQFIKMDIEGAEGELLNDADFMQWISGNEILFEVELHNKNVIPAQYPRAKTGNTMFMVGATA